MKNSSVVLKSLIAESKDGEWGKEEPFECSIFMNVIRGTDFESVEIGDIDTILTRYIKEDIACRKALKANDIIIETAGGSKNKPTGRTIFIKDKLLKRFSLPVTCASFSRFIRIDSQMAYPRYIYYYLKYLYIAGHIFKYHTQHTGVSRFQWTVFSENKNCSYQEQKFNRKSPLFFQPMMTLLRTTTGGLRFWRKWHRLFTRNGSSISASRDMRKSK